MLPPMPSVEKHLELAVAALGRGNYARALRLFKPLAEIGDADAQRHLGILYRLGLGVRQDLVQAHLWFSLAAHDRRQAPKERDEVAAEMTSAELDRARDLAREWKPKR